MTDEPRHDFTDGLYGWITHTDLASTDPDATTSWCAEVLGWDFPAPLVTPSGTYQLFRYSESGGGGIRSVAPGEAPGSTPTVHVRDAHTPPRRCAVPPRLAARRLGGAESTPRRRPPRSAIAG
jgi:hypothetical protein